MPFHMVNILQTQKLIPLSLPKDTQKSVLKLSFESTLYEEKHIT